VLNARRLVLLGAALSLSTGTVVFAQQWMHSELKRSSTRAAQVAHAPEVRVLVAREALPMGAVLRADQLRWQAWPAGDLSADYLTSAHATPEQLAGAVLRSPLSAGEPLTAGGVARPGERGLMAATLRPGMRAITINVSASTGVAGFVAPGDHVDLILTRMVEGAGAKRFVSETVLQDLRVVGMDQRASNEKKDAVVPQTATLEVTPKQAEVAAVASELGKLSLSLRSLAVDGAAPASQGVTRTWDRDATQTPAPAPAKVGALRRASPPAAVVQVIRGSQINNTPGSPR
jgi:pilus assembly protein CpaB